MKHTNLKLLAQTMRDFSETSGDHHMQAAAAIDSYADLIAKSAAVPDGWRLVDAEHLVKLSERIKAIAWKEGQLNGDDRHRLAELALAVKVAATLAAAPQPAAPKQTPLQEQMAADEYEDCLPKELSNFLGTIAALEGGSVEPVAWIKECEDDLKFNRQIAVTTNPNNPSWVRLYTQQALDSAVLKAHDAAIERSIELAKGIALSKWREFAPQRK